MGRQRWSFLLSFPSIQFTRWPTLHYGRPYDAIKTFGPIEAFVTDNKTTKSFLGPTTGNSSPLMSKLTIYDLAGSLLFPDLGLKGVAIEAAQTLVGGAKFATQTFYRTEGQREETTQ